MERRKGTQMNELDIKRQSFMKKLNYGVAALVTIVAAGLIILAGGLTMVAGTMIIGGLVVVNAIPVFSRKLAIWKFKELKQTAIDNPIETMEMESQAQADEIENSRKAYDAREAQGKAFIQEIDEMAKEDPEGAAMYKQQIEDYHTEMEARTQELTKAVQDHEEFKQTLKLFRIRWKAALAASAFDANKPGEKERVLRNVLVDEAMDAVRRKANESAARLKSNAVVTKAREDFKNRKAGRVTSTEAVAQAIGLDQSPPLTFDVSAKVVDSIPTTK